MLLHATSKILRLQCSLLRSQRLLLSHTTSKILTFQCLPLRSQRFLLLLLLLLLMSVPAFDDPNVLYSYFLRSQVSSYLVLHFTMDLRIFRAGERKLKLCCVAFDDKVLHNAQGVCYSCWQPTCVPPVSLCGRRTVAPATQHHTPHQDQTRPHGFSMKPDHTASS